MQERLRPAWAELDLGALAHNLSFVRRLAGARRLIASVKANGYGHGAVAIADALVRLGVETLWTGEIDEAIAIREAGIDARLLMFGGYAPDLIPELLRRGLTPTIYDEAGAQAATAAAERPMPVYVKVDSGLGRLGVPLDEAFELILRLAALPNLPIEGIYTHLPFGDEAGRGWTLERHRAFEQLLARLSECGIDPPVTQAWASSGLLAQLPDGCNTVCVGHLLYGLSPVAEAVAASHELRPVMSAIRTRLIHVARHAAGRDTATAGGYVGHNARTHGVAAMGLGDGLRRPAPGQTMSVLVRGRRAPAIGVSLEHLTLDLTDIRDVQVGDEVVVVGESGKERNTLADLARCFGCAELEAAMAFSKRLAFRASSLPSHAGLPRPARQ